jgi:cytochrome b subunit of formate dehydrogenase
MGPARLVRFSRAEIALHWAFVPPYLVLGATGLALLAGKNLGAWLAPREALARAHLAAGAALVVLPALVLIASRPEPFRRLLGEAFRWRWKDIAWLLAAALRILIPRTPLPPAGRFNAGQKLNLLHVALLVPSVAATGFLLWAGGGAFLLLRLLHAAGALGSLALAAGHLYLALVHPPTRRALGSIFHGKVPADYAASHHATWYRELTGAEAGPHPLARRWTRRRTAIAAIAAGASAGLGVVMLWIPGLRADMAEVANAYLGEPRRLIEPAALHPLHRGVEELSKCGGCHTAAGPVPDASCIACHEEVGERARSQVGLHGRWGRGCAGCHADHGERIIRFDERGFNHDLAAFRLEGAHRGLACERCHEERGRGSRRYLGLAAACSGCHADPHAPSLGGDCRHCHEEDAWTPVAPSFDHDLDTRFPLDARHGPLACASCHAGDDALQLRRGRWDAAAAERGFPCEDCHAVEGEALAGKLPAGDARNPSPHLGKVACDGCHRLEPVARTEPCSECHPRDYDGLAIDWRARLDQEILRLEAPPAAKASWRSAGAHHWEAAVDALRKGATARAGTAGPITVPR